MDSVKRRGSFVLDALSSARARGCSQPSPAAEAALGTHSSRPLGSTHTSFWFDVNKFDTRRAFFIGDAMDQMADEMTPRADERDKGRVNTAEESSAWARGGEFM